MFVFHCVLDVSCHIAQNMVVIHTWSLYSVTVITTPLFMPLNNIAFHMVLETDQTSDPSVLALSLNFCSNAVGEALVITVTVIRLVLYCGREMTLGSSQILKVWA